MLKIALPSGKSLEERTLELLSEVRINADRSSSRSHAVSFSGYPGLSSGQFLKPFRIPKLVEDGRFDIGITGYDAVIESGAAVKVLSRLPYSKTTEGGTRAVLFVHKDDPLERVEDIPSGAPILSEYPVATRAFFAERGLSVEVIPTPGGAEAEVPEQYRFGVALTETGQSLRANGLRVIETLFESTTVLIASREAPADEAKRHEMRVLTLLLEGALEARRTVLISMNVPNERIEAVLKRIPTLRSPTISPLADEGFRSVSSVVPASEANQVISDLLREGARDILVLPVLSIVRDL